jgi:hypothetical protein
VQIFEPRYVSHYGIDFGPLPDGTPFPKVNAALNISKKWRRFEAAGMKPNCDPAECTIDAARMLFKDELKITPWTEQMLRDYTMHKEVIFIGPASSGKSHVLALCSVLLYICDPINTACIMCSSTLADLKERAWSPVKEFVALLRNNQDFQGAAIKILDNEYCVCNEANEKVPETLTKRASIRGVALDEGRIQGQHVKGEGSTTLLVIDELSLVRNIVALNTGIMNISVGTDYRFLAAANPESWSSEVSSRFLTPVGGPGMVTPETGHWISKSGYFVRHFDGEKSPAILQPEFEHEWPFLLSGKTRVTCLEKCNGDREAADYMKMVRGWPASISDGALTVLDPVVAGRERATEPLESPMSGMMRTPLGGQPGEAPGASSLAAGVDPAWSSSGDAAVMATCKVWQQDGKVFLDFLRGVADIQILSAPDLPVLSQLRNGVLARMRADGGPQIRNIAVDSSGNQSLHDELTTFVGPGCLAVNSSVVASDYPLRAGDGQKAKARIADRGTESWMVLAEFIRAGMVRGLPQIVVNDLCNRRFATRGQSGEPTAKSKLEPKADFGKRMGKGSPNETDACALAALAVKERLGVQPFGSLDIAQVEAVAPSAYARPGDVYVAPDLSSEYSADGCSSVGGYS